MNPQTNDQPGNEDNQTNSQQKEQASPVSDSPANQAGSNDQQTAEMAQHSSGNAQSPPPQEPRPSQAPPQQAPAQPDNKLAVTSLVLGILAMFLGWVFIIGPLLAIAGLIFGIKARKKHQSEGMAIAGTILSGISLAFNILIWVIIAVSLYFGLQHSATDQERKDDLTTIAGSLEEYYDDNAFYPYAEDASDLEGVVADEIPKDPNGEAYIYETSGCADNKCRGFRLIAELQYDKSEDIDHDIEEYDNAYAIESRGGEFTE